MSSIDPQGSEQPPSWAERFEKGQLDDETRQAIWRDFDSGWVMVSELVGATLTWGALGWLADRWLGIEPILMSVGFILGFSTGFYLVWGRTTGRIRKPRGRRTKPTPADGASPDAITHDTQPRAKDTTDT